MNNVRVICLVNGKKQRQIISSIVSDRKLILCYDNRHEKIFKNNDFLISCHKKYNNIYCFSQSAIDEIHKRGLYQ